MTDRGLLDTSVLIASETGRPLRAEAVPDLIAVSVVTVAELRAGVLAARDTAVRARRMRTLEILDDAEVLPVDRQVADLWAEFRVLLAEAGRRINVNDLWIAATAARHGIPVVTQDDDYAPVQDLAGIEVVRV